MRTYGELLVVIVITALLSVGAVAIWNLSPWVLVAVFIALVTGAVLASYAA